jgi:hypothetical protein
MDNLKKVNANEDSSIYIRSDGIIELKDKNISLTRQDILNVLSNAGKILSKHEIMQILNKSGNNFLAEFFKLKERWNIWRYKNDDDFCAAREWLNPFAFCMDYSEFHGNLALNEGAETIIDALTGLASITQYSNANARLGVGNSSAVAADTQTGLQGGSTEFVAMDTSYPLKSGTGNDTLVVQSVFSAALGNFAWEEFTCDNGSTPNKNLNRLVSSQGVKSSPQSWTLKLDLQFT